LSVYDGCTHRRLVASKTRIAGVPPSAAVLDDMAADVARVARWMRPYTAMAKPLVL
jgi:hypothetical protein